VRVTTTQQGTRRDALRRLSFLFQDGLVLATTLRGLDAIGLLEASLEHEETVADLRPGITDTGFGHVRVGLRTLAQAGWIVPAAGMTADAATISWTVAGRAAAEHRASYLALGEYLATFSSGAPRCCGSTPPAGCAAAPARACPTTTSARSWRASSGRSAGWPRTAPGPPTAPAAWTSWTTSASPPPTCRRWRGCPTSTAVRWSAPAASTSSAS
jgi:hypothetical protein